MNAINVHSCAPASEDALLALIDACFPNSHSCVALGRGDDCAVFQAGPQFCVSSDLFLEDVHFRRSYFRPQEIGHKALAVNLSDLAAMGARPLAFTLALGVPHDCGMAWLEALLRGMAALAQDQDVVLAGGDLSQSDKLHISITVIGERPQGSALLLRGGNMSGDVLFIVGELGLARIGLMELEARGAEAREAWPASCRSHLMPMPRIGAALMLGRAAYNSRPPSLMDVSDGLARDLPRLLDKGRASGLGAELDIPKDMLHAEVLRHARCHGRDPALDAYEGGEDYALLGACAPDMAPALRAAIPGFRQIGRITEAGVITCNGVLVDSASGFDHFRQDKWGGSHE